MLTRHGHLFHLDFGYIFGKDPKPFPAPIRITKEMIDAMGGPTSKHYARFVALSCQAFNILRKSAPVVLSLLSLMSDAGIEMLPREEADVILGKLQDKFRLDLDDEAAEVFFVKLLDDSVAAFFPFFFEYVHKIRVAMR